MRSYRLCPLSSSSTSHISLHFPWGQEMSQQGMILGKSVNYSLVSLIHCRLAFKFVQSLLAATPEKHEQALNWMSNHFVLSHLQTEAREEDRSRHWELGCVYAVMPAKVPSAEQRTCKVNEGLKNVPGLACLDEAAFQPQEILSDGVLALRSLHPPSTRARLNHCLVPRHSQEQVINTDIKNGLNCFLLTCQWLS